jgi:predicted permease
MEFSIIQSVLPSFAIAFLGYIYSIKDNTLDMKSIANLIYYVFSPCLVFTSLSKRTFQFQEFLMIGSSVIVLIFAMMLITCIYMKITKVDESGFYLPIIFMNTGNIALPMALFLYGNEGLSKAIVFHLINVLFLYTMGVFIVSRKSNIKEFFKIPFVYAAILGLLAAVFPSMPESICRYSNLLCDGIEILGQGSIPLLILSLGYSLKRTKLADVGHGIAGASLRIVMGPAIAFGMVMLFRHIGWAPIEEGYELSQYAGVRTTEAIIILMGAMPAPITSFLLNEKFDNCPSKAASMVLIGTIAGVVTIPLILALSHNFIFTN